MKIFINGNKWSTSRITFSDWKPIEISEKNADLLIRGKTSLNFEKTTDKKAVVFSAEEFKRIKDQIDYKRSMKQKSQEVQDFIYSRYSKTDQDNMKSKILYEREITGKVLKSTKEDGKEMFEWISMVVNTFRSKGLLINFKELEKKSNV